MPKINEQRLREEVLQPQAQPLDVYVPPAQRAPDDTLRSLAYALDSFQPVMDRKAAEQRAEAKRLAAEQAREQEEADKTRAQRQFVLDEANAELAQVAAGDRYPQESKYFRKMYAYQAGLTRALEESSKLTKEYEESGLANADNPEAFDAWMKERAAAAVGRYEDPDEAAGALPVLQRTLAELRGTNERTVADNIVTGMANSAAQEVHTRLDQAFEAAAKEQRGFSAADVWPAINAMKDRGRFVGLPGETLNKLVVDAAVDKAIAYADPGILDEMSKQTWTDPKTGQSVPGPFSGAYYLGMKEDVAMRIEARQEALARKAEEAARESRFWYVREKEMLAEQGQLTEYDLQEMLDQGLPDSSVLTLDRKNRDQLALAQRRDYIKRVYEAGRITETAELTTAERERGMMDFGAQVIQSLQERAGDPEADVTGQAAAVILQRGAQMATPFLPWKHQLEAAKPEDWPSFLGAAQLYGAIRDHAPTSLGAYVSDPNQAVMYDTFWSLREAGMAEENIQKYVTQFGARDAQERARRYLSGDAGKAISDALDKELEVTVPKKLWPDGAETPGNTTYVMDQVRELALLHLATGQSSPAKAVEFATTLFKSNHTSVNGRWLGTFGRPVPPEFPQMAEDYLSRFEVPGHDGTPHKNPQGYLLGTDRLTLRDGSYPVVEADTLMPTGKRVSVGDVLADVAKTYAQDVETSHMSFRRKVGDDAYKTYKAQAIVELRKESAEALRRSKVYKDGWLPGGTLSAQDIWARDRYAKEAKEQAALADAIEAGETEPPLDLMERLDGPARAKRLREKQREGAPDGSPRPTPLLF